MATGQNLLRDSHLTSSPAQAEYVPAAGTCGEFERVSSRVWGRGDHRVARATVPLCPCTVAHAPSPSIPDRKPPAARRVPSTVGGAHFYTAESSFSTVLIPTVMDIEDLVGAPEREVTAPLIIPKKIRKRTAHTETKHLCDTRQENAEKGQIPGRASIYIKTFGCAHNMSDSEYMQGILESYGYSFTTGNRD